MFSILEQRQNGRNFLFSKLSEHLIDYSQEIAALEADVLLAKAISKDQLFILTRSSEKLSDTESERFHKFLERRAKCEPVAYITGEKEFYGRMFSVTPDVLIPRPETELVVERALEILKERSSDVCLVDVGSGSGIIPLTILSELNERRQTLKNVFASDISKSALAVAMNNAKCLSLYDQIKFLCGNLLEPLNNLLSEVECSFELITANLPYVADKEILPLEVDNYEPQLALRGGENGLGVISRLLEQIVDAKMPNRPRTLLLEIGSSQAHALESRLRGASNYRFFNDLAGIPRVLEINWIRHA